MYHNSVRTAPTVNEPTVKKKPAIGDTISMHWRLHATVCIPKECTTSGKLRHVSWSIKQHSPFFLVRKILKLVLLLVRYQEQSVVLWWPEAWQGQGGPSCTKLTQLCTHTRGNGSAMWEEGDSAFLWISYVVQTALNGICTSLPQNKNETKVSGKKKQS